MRKKHGFTWAKLLRVVAIGAGLVAVAIPVLNNQLEKSREAADIDMLRQAYSAAMLCYSAGKWDDGEEIRTGSSNLYLFGVYNPVTGKCVSWMKKGTQPTAELRKATPKAKIKGWQGKKPDWKDSYFNKQNGMPGYEGFPTNINNNYRSDIGNVKEIHIYFDSKLRLGKVYFGNNNDVY